jgi:hypothetical protein
MMWPEEPAMRYEMRAEHSPEGGPVKVWHMVHENGTAALCGRDLDARAATRPWEAWGTTAEPFCHTCGALYLREVP